MVRTSGGIKISSGKSSKKGGSGGSSSSSRGSSASTSSKSARGNNIETFAERGSRLPPIPHQETPSWQKPITNFFLSGCSSSKNIDTAVDDTNIDKETDTIIHMVSSNENEGIIEPNSCSKHGSDKDEESSNKIDIPSESLQRTVDKTSHEKNKENEVDLDKSLDQQVSEEVQKNMEPTRNDDEKENNGPNQSQNNEENLSSVPNIEKSVESDNETKETQAKKPRIE